MSRIAAVVHGGGPPVVADVLAALTGAKVPSHQEPVASWVDGSVGVAGSPPAGRPPDGSLAMGDGLVVAADARIDNRAELLHSLNARGQPEKDGISDCELILASYRRWGRAAPSHITGDFAFALWDGNRRELFCARDPLGVRPLHYHHGGSVFCIASEAQHILRHPRIPWELDRKAMADFLIDNHRDQESTLFAGVRRLPPGCAMRVGAQGVRIERYWDIDPEPPVRHRSSRPSTEQFFHLLSESVDDRLRTAAPVIGVAVSGGLDSSSVMALAGRGLQARSDAAEPRGYSYAFSDMYGCDEWTYGRAVAELGVPIERIDADRFGLRGDTQAFDPVLETPSLLWQSLERQVVNRLRDRGGEVLLDGWGADQLLAGGSPQYWSRLRRTPVVQAFRPLVRGGRRRSPALPEPGHRHPPWASPQLVNLLQTERPAITATAVPRLHSPATQHRYRSLFSSALGGVVYRLNRAGNAAGVEVRHPFLDRRLVEFVLSLPSSEVAGRRPGKRILRAAMKGILPEPVRLRADKADFKRYHYLTFRQAVLGRAQKVFEQPLLTEFGLAEPSILRATLAKIDAGADDQLYSTARAFELELWLRAFGAQFA